MEAELDIHVPFGSEKRWGKDFQVYLGHGFARVKNRFDGMGCIGQIDASFASSTARNRENGDIRSPRTLKSTLVGDSRPLEWPSGIPEHFSSRWTRAGGLPRN